MNIGAWSYPVLRLKRLGLSKTFRRLVVTLIRPADILISLIQHTVE